MENINIWIPLGLTVLAGLSTGVGSLIAFFIKNYCNKFLCFSLGMSAGVMLYVSFVELLPEAIKSVGFFYANLAFFGGILFIMLIDFLIPHKYIEERVNVPNKHKKLMAAGIFTAIGIAIHNIPEGLAVFISSVDDLSLGIPLAFAIALHNIPEGIAVAIPICYATKSKRKAVFWSFLSGVAEPLGAVIGIIFLMPYLNETILNLSLAFVAGIMVFISFDELLPVAYKENHTHISDIGVIVGMFIMASSLYFL
jgi:zinc transporter, ZIP family